MPGDPRVRGQIAAHEHVAHGAHRIARLNFRLGEIYAVVRPDNGPSIAVCKRLGMQPVFFGETIVGANQPNLVYMLSYEDLSAREKAWKAFGADDEWKKLRETPGYSDAEIVSNISNYLVTPLPFSPIR